MIKWVLFLIVNVVFAALYFYGLDHNRYICAALWVIAPLFNIALFGIKE